MSKIRLSFFVLLGLTIAACGETEEKRSIVIDGETIEYTLPSVDSKDVTEGKKFHEEHTRKRRASEGISAEVAGQFAPLEYKAYSRAEAAGDNWISETDAILGQFDKLVKAYPNSPEVRWRYNSSLATTVAKVASNPRPGGLEYIEVLSNRSLENVRSDTSLSHNVFAAHHSIFLSEWWIRALNDAESPKEAYKKPLTAIMHVREKMPQNDMIARAHAEVYTRIDFDKLGTAELRDFDALIQEFRGTPAFQSKIEKLSQLPGYQKRIQTP